MPPEIGAFSLEGGGPVETRTEWALWLAGSLFAESSEEVEEREREPCEASLARREAIEEERESLGNHKEGEPPGERD